MSASKQDYNPIYFQQWFENECHGETEEGSRNYSNLEEAFAKGMSIGFDLGEEHQKEVSISTIRKFFETEFENVIDALEEHIR